MPLSEKVLRTLINKLTTISTSLTKIGRPLRKWSTDAFSGVNLTSSLKARLVTPLRHIVENGSTNKENQIFTNSLTLGLLDVTDFVFRTLTFSKVRVLYIANN